METGETEGESVPEEPLPGETGKEGKRKGRKLSSQKGTEADERKRRGTEKAEKKGT